MIRQLRNRLSVPISVAGESHAGDLPCGPSTRFCLSYIAADCLPVRVRFRTRVEFQRFPRLREFGLEAGDFCEKVIAVVQQLASPRSIGKAIWPCGRSANIFRVALSDCVQISGHGHTK